MSGQLSTLRDAYKTSLSVEGFLSRHEGILLWYLARLGTGKGAIVEIGSWKGKSTVWLALGSRLANREKVIAVDPHTGSIEHREKYGTVNTFDEFLHNIRSCGIDDWVVPFLGTSKEAAEKWKGRIRLVFIDGSHEYDDVKQDFRLWFNRLDSGGTIALHDSYLVGGGPSRLVEELLVHEKRAIHVGFVGSITFFTKGRGSFAQQTRNLFLALMLKTFRKAGSLGNPPIRFWLDLVLSTSDRSGESVFWVYWQAFFNLRDGSQGQTGRVLAQGVFFHEI